MVIDIHGHLGNINFSEFWQADAERLEQYLRESGTDRLCLSASRAIMYDIREGNAELAAVLKSHESFYGYVVISPTFPGTEEELHYLEDEPKFRGVKIHPDYHGYDLSVPSNYRFVDRLASRTPMMLFHVSCMPGTGFSSAETVVSIAKNHPDTKFVLAHCAGLYQNGNYPFFPNMDSLERICDAGLPPNVWIDTAHYLLYAYQTIMAKMVRLAGAEHVVFGTDCPLQGPMQMRFAQEAVRALDIPEAQKDAILFGNARKILGLE
ncbi:MAG: amidohydrolase [Victivallales bacterium]|nr:amidohydrolase [Victivallales bacterium]